MQLHLRIYYQLKPYMPVGFRMALRQMYARRLRVKHEHDWPIDDIAGQKPAGWRGWPGGKEFAVVLTHDVESAKGVDRCRQLAEMESFFGFRSSFNFVPEKYQTPAELRDFLRGAGFEIGVHGLKHDGKLYQSRELFQKKAKRINHYLNEWNAVGFRSPLMHHNLEWIHDLDIKYDASTFDTDPFEPQPTGVGTIFPFWKAGHNGSGYVELPYTLPQDSSLFLVLQEKDISIWKKKLSWIAARGGMVLLIVHPDYMNFSSSGTAPNTYPASFYSEFLRHVSETYAGKYWHALPKQIANYIAPSNVSNESVSQEGLTRQEAMKAFAAIPSERPPASR
jgi:hypothetical protein